VGVILGATEGDAVGVRGGVVMIGGKGVTTVGALVGTPRVVGSKVGAWVVGSRLVGLVVTT